MAIQEFVLSYVEALNTERFQNHPHSSVDEVMLEGTQLLLSCCDGDREATAGIASRLMYWLGTIPEDVSMGSLKLAMVEHAWRVYIETCCTSTNVGYA